MKQKRQTETGFSLIELLVAVAILGVALTPLLGIFVHGMRTGEKSNKMTIAVTLARDLNEEIRSMPFYDPNIAFNEAKSVNYFPANKTTRQPFGYLEDINVVAADVAYDTSKSRQGQLDDVDDYNGWCRGQDCDCAGKPAGICLDDTPLEANAPLDGTTTGPFKYDGQNGRPIYRGFTRSVRVFNVGFQNITGTHDIDFNIDNTHFPNTARNKTFLYYDLRDGTLENKTGVDIDGLRLPAKGLSRIKVVDVTVSYDGLLAKGVAYRDRGLVVLPISQAN